MMRYAYGCAFLLVAATIAYFWIRNDAKSDLTDELEKINADLRRGSLTASAASSDCFAAGGVWDFATDRCKEPN